MSPLLSRIYALGQIWLFQVRQWLTIFRSTRTRSVANHPFYRIFSWTLSGSIHGYCLEERRLGSTHVSMEISSWDCVSLSVKAVETDRPSIVCHFGLGIHRLQIGGGKSSSHPENAYFIDVSVISFDLCGCPFDSSK
jgi:hypothetical protein